MEKRRETRYRIRQLVNISNKIGVMNDISRKGINITLPVFPKERKIDLIMKIDGEDVRISAIIMWAKKKFHYSDHNTMGMILINPPPSFLDYCSSLDN